MDSVMPIPIEDSDRAEVEFVAYFESTRACSLELHHERSRFERDGTAWVYTEVMPVLHAPPPAPDSIVSVARPQRNSDCPCGRGSKYKRCCGRW